MLKNLIKNIRYGSTYGAIELTDNDVGEKLVLLVLKKVKNEFEIKIKNEFTSIKEVANSINNEQHLYLVVNNNQVLSKSIIKELNNDKAVQLAYPNIKTSDFYYEILQLKEKTIVSICRKDYVHNLIKKYQEQQLNIIGFNLGNSSITQLLPFIENSTLLSSNASFVKTNNQPTSIEFHKNSNDTLYSINGIEISNKYVLTLASTIGYFINNTITENNFQKFNASINKQYFQKRIFNLGLKIGVVLLFISLLINFLLFDYYNKNIESLSQKAQINQSYKDQLLLLNTEISNKKKLVDEIINSSTSKTSLYFDEIGMNIPNTILLNSIDYQPILKNIEENKKIILNYNTILIKGSSSNGLHFSNWIKSLEILDWVKSVAIVNYGSEKNKKTTFEIRIILV